MLVLTRKLMEKLFIGDDICVTVVRLEGGQVRLGIDAPREVSVVRAELVPERQGGRPAARPTPSRPRPRRRTGAVPARRPARRTARGSGFHQPRLMEPIADAADGLDEVGGVAELLAQALDVDVDRPLQDDGVLADRRVHQLVAGERPARLAEQDLQEAELGRRQRQLLARGRAPGGCGGRSSPPGSRSPSPTPARPAPAACAAPS